MKIELDHVGIVGPDLDALVVQFAALGFAVQGPGMLELAGDAPPVQRSAHVMFGDTYLELTSAPGCAPDYHLYPYTQCPPGLHLLLLRSADAARTQRGLRAQGVVTSTVQSARRQLTYGDRCEAGFRWFALEEPLHGDTLVGWVEHQNAEQVFAASACQHANGVQGISALLLRRPLPQIVDSSAGEIRVVNTSTAEVVEVSNTLLGLELSTERLDRCAQQLSNKGVPYARHAGEIRVAAQFAGGAQLRFVEARP